MGKALFVLYIHVNQKLKHMTVEKALTELIGKGARIEQIKADKFMVYDNGFWGFCSDEDPFIVDGEEILEMHEQYVDGAK